MDEKLADLKEEFEDSKESYLNATEELQAATDWLANRKQYFEKDLIALTTYELKINEKHENK